MTLVETCLAAKIPGKTLRGTRRANKASGQITLVKVHETGPRLSSKLGTRLGVYRQVIALWPESVEVPVRSRLGESSFCFSHLVTIYYVVEKRILYQEVSDNKLRIEKLRIMNWSIYQICREYAERALASGSRSIWIQKLPQNAIVHRFYTNLSDPIWKGLKSAVEQFALRT